MLVLSFFFRFLIRKGTLRIIDVDGKEHTYRASDGPEVTLKFHKRDLYWRLLTSPYLAFGEGYMRRDLTIEQGTLEDFLLLFVLNQDRMRRLLPVAIFRKIASAFDFLTQHNPVGRAARKVAHHYDISNEMYRLFLDRDMQYSCAYFLNLENALEQAQDDKKKIIMAKLMLAPGQRVLDIGCGWGGLAITMAREYGVEVVGVTLSQAQYELARRRIADAGLADRVDIRLVDYRLLTEKFDRIVSVGMFEHVGRRHYREYFEKAYDLLNEDGVMLLHSIGHVWPVPVSNPWVDKYIFPGAYVPALSEVLPHAERTKFWVCDIDIWRRHYAYTLRGWKERFRANRAAVLTLKDDVFFRMWDMYLTAFEIAFIHGQLMVFQIQLAKNNRALPMTRDYMYAPLAPDR